MKRLVFTCSAMLLFASAAFAGGMELTMEACPGLGGVSSGTVDCGNEPVITLLITFAPNENLPDLLGFDGFIEMQVPDGLDANNFWKVDAAGCGGSGLVGLNNRPTTGCSNHTNTWSGGIGNAAAIQRGANVQRIGIAAARATQLNVTANQRLFGLQLLFNANGDLEAGGCTGCSAPAGLVLTDIVPATAGTFPSHITGPSGTFPNVGTCMMLNGASQANCLAVPARRQTWGQLKSLYR